MKKDSRTIFRKIVLYIIIIILAVCNITAGFVIAFPRRADQEQAEIIESNLLREKQKFEKFDSREKDLLLQVSELERDVSEKRRIVDALREKIRIARVEIKKLEETQADLTKSLDDAETKAARRLVALYKYARKGYFKILANFKTMDQSRRGMVYLKAISAADRKELKRLSEECQRYQKEIAQINSRINRKESEERKENVRLAALREDLEKKVIRLMRIHQEKKFYETAVKELQLAAQDFKQTFVNIEKKEKYEAVLSSRFEDAKNRLPFPVDGKVIKGDKFFRNKPLKQSKGVFIEGFDAEVKAIFPGRVDFSGSLKGYGDLIVINHGSRFYTISAQLSQRLREEGDMVESGDVIGIVGQNGKTQKTRLYFEIRKAGQSLDPLSWLKRR